RLSSEVLEKCDLLVGKRPDFGTKYRQGPEQRVIFAQGDAGKAAGGTQLDERPRGARPGKVVRLLAQVRRPNDGLARHDPLGDVAGPRFKLLALAEDLYQRGRRPAQGHG